MKGHLTDVRTAVAGAIAAKFLAPDDPGAIGIAGTGIQARLQAIWLKRVTGCRRLYVWGRDSSKAGACAADLAAEGFETSVAASMSELAAHCRLIVTTTPANSAILQAADIRPGTHITAMGSDTPEKQELDSEILAKADLVVADSVSQCLERGEIFKALGAGAILQSELVELGQVIESGEGRTRAGSDHGRRSDRGGCSGPEDSRGRIQGGWRLSVYS